MLALSFINASEAGLTGRKLQCCCGGIYFCHYELRIAFELCSCEAIHVKAGRLNGFSRRLRFPSLRFQIKKVSLTIKPPFFVFIFSRLSRLISGRARQDFLAFLSAKARRFSAGYGSRQLRATFRICCTRNILSGGFQAVL